MVLFLTDSRSALTLLSTAPAFLQPKTFGIFGAFPTPSFQWVLMLDFPEMNWQIRSPTLSFTHVPYPLAPTVAKIRHTYYFFGYEILLTTPSPARFLRLPRRNYPFPISSAVNCLDFAATVTASSCPLTYAGWNRRRIIHAAPAITLCRI